LNLERHACGRSHLSYFFNIERHGYLLTQLMIWCLANRVL
jgi:hypothetical protein